MSTETKLLPLLSGSFRNLLEEVVNSFNDPIAANILTADNLIRAYNNIQQSNIFYDSENIEIEKGCVLNTIFERISDMLNENARMLNMRKGEFEISFLPEGKEPVYLNNNVWGRQNRQTAKPTRLIQKLLKTKYSCAEFEDFNNRLKAACLGRYEWRILEGSDITKYYNYNYYVEEAGTLGNSCMRYGSCAEFFKVYEDEARMLVLYDPAEDKIAGRALLWNIGGYIYMDRVYTAEDHQLDQFIAYAKENNWFIREDNRLLESGMSQCWLGPDDNYSETICPDLSIHLSKTYEYFPYMDSFRYLDTDENTLYTRVDHRGATLAQTDGSRGYEYICSVCGRVSWGADSEDAEMVWSDYQDDYICENCAMWVERLSDYVPWNTTMVEIDEDPDDRMPYDMVKHNNDYVEIDNRWYSTCGKLVEYNETTGNYELISEEDEN